MFVLTLNNLGIYVLSGSIDSIPKDDEYTLHNIVYLMSTMLLAS